MGSSQSGLAALVCSTVLVCSSWGSATVDVQAARPNIVLVILDDVGVEKLGVYGEAPPAADPPCTPNIDALAAQGLLFRNAWADPLCSATRAQILTGRHNFRTVARSGGKDWSLALAQEAHTLPRVLVGYDSSAVGKWHLAQLGPYALRHPLDCGFGYFAGTLITLTSPPVSTPAEPVADCRTNGELGYTNWVKAVAQPGAISQRCVTTYATTDTADEAIARAQAMRPPWLLQVGFQSAHEPLQEPPAALVPSREVCPRGAKDREARFRMLDAMITALDMELGRMLSEIRRLDPSVVVLLIGDNGTAAEGSEGASGECFSDHRTKFSVYQGGIRVPLIVAGPGVVAGISDALVSATDVLATLAELAHVTVSTEDSVSLVPLLHGAREPRRKSVYAEMFRFEETTRGLPGRVSNHMRAIRDERFKLIRISGPKGTHEELYDLQLDPCETRELLRAEQSEGREPSEAERASLAELRAGLVELGVYD